MTLTTDGAMDGAYGMGGTIQWWGKKKLIQTSCILTYAIVGEYCRIKEHNVAGGITFLLLYL